MITSRGQTNSKKEAGRQFSEWASLFSGKLFVHLVVYADESGTHDKTGNQIGSSEAVVGGIAAIREDWIPFCTAWQKVLNKYRVPYFHFREWSTASGVARKTRKPNSDFKKNPYQHLELKQLNDFLIELATIAGSGNKFSFGAWVPTKIFHEARFEGHSFDVSNPYESCLLDFFDNFLKTLRQLKPAWKRQPVSFFFDQSDDKEWRHAITDAFHYLKKIHPRVAELSFADKKDPLHLPLQAADLIAYRSRYIVGKAHNKDWSGDWAQLDEALFKPMNDWHTARGINLQWKLGQK